MRSSIWLGLTLAGWAATSVTGAQVTKQGDAYLFRVKYKKGAKYSFLLSSSSPATSGIPAQKLEVPFSYLVLGTKGDETEVKISVGPSKFNGKPNTPQPQIITATLDDRGKLIKSTQKGMGNLTGVILPEKPVKIGGEFPIKSDNSVDGGALELRGAYAFKGFKTMSGRKVAQFDVRQNSTGMASISGGGKTFIDVADGLLLLATIDQIVTIQQNGKSISVKNQVTIIRK